MLPGNGISTKAGSAWEMGKKKTTTDKCILNQVKWKERELKENDLRLGVKWEK